MFLSHLCSENFIKCLVWCAQKRIIWRLLNSTHTMTRLIYGLVMSPFVTFCHLKSIISPPTSNRSPLLNKLKLDQFLQIAYRCSLIASCKFNIILCRNLILRNFSKKQALPVFSCRSSSEIQYIGGDLRGYCLQQ